VARGAHGVLTGELTGVLTECSRVLTGYSRGYSRGYSPSAHGCSRGTHGGTHGVLKGVLIGCSWGTHGGTHRVLTGYSRGTGEFLPYREYWRDPTIPNAMAAHQTLHWHGVFSGSEPHPSFEHAQLARTHTRPLRQSLPPAVSVPWSARVLLSAHVLWCRSLARASSRSTWCVPVTGVLVQYMRRSNGTGVLCPCA
jgi:hypothetical protein